MLRSVDMRAALCALLAALLAARAVAQERTAPRCRDQRCRGLGLDARDWPHYEVDGNNIKISVTINHLQMSCHGASVLQSPALPSYEPALQVSLLDFYNCPLPAAGSLADTLAALNVTLERSHSETPDKGSTLRLQELPAGAPLSAKHFVGLERLVELEIKGNDETRPTAEPGFLVPLQSLRSLEISSVGLLTGEMDVPLSLRKLSLFRVNVTRLPVQPALDYLSLNSWTESRPAPLTRCNLLTFLFLYKVAVDTLPDGWLQNCPRLEVLSIEFASNLTTLPPKLLAGTSGLKQLTILRGTLPTGFLDYSPNLYSLTFSSNHLQTLPSGMFDVARRIQKVLLHANDLDSSAVEVLATLVELNVLYLDFNPRVGDFCGADGYSSIRNLTKLTGLHLVNTGVNRICRDWREDMLLLDTLDLSGTKVTELSLHIRRNVTAEVRLQRLAAPVTVAAVTREQYDEAARGVTGDVYVRADELAPVECDCRMYWTRRALDLSLPIFQLINEMSCTDGRPLREVPAEDMECSRPEECTQAALPRACTCAVRPDADSSRGRLLVRVRCERAGLASVPRPRARDDSAERLYDLQLAHNNISELHADDLNNIKGLDLRNNFLTGVDEKTASRLGDIAGMLRVSGNPLECSWPLLRALRARPATQTDWVSSTCGAASSPGAAPPGCPAAPLAALLAALAVLW